MVVLGCRGLIPTKAEGHTRSEECKDCQNFVREQTARRVRTSESISNSFTLDAKGSRRILETNRSKPQSHLPARYAMSR